VQGGRGVDNLKGLGLQKIIQNPKPPEGRSAEMRQRTELYADKWSDTAFSGCEKENSEYNSDQENLCTAQ
jgi:hypothetical protein